MHLLFLSLVQSAQQPLADCHNAQRGEGIITSTENNTRAPTCRDHEIASTFTATGESIRLT